MSADVVSTAGRDGDGEKREKQGEPDSSLRHGEADWLNPLESVSDYIGKYIYVYQGTSVITCWKCSYFQNNFNRRNFD